MKTPTLAQLKNRPAAWVIYDSTSYAELRITMPDGSIWYYTDGWYQDHGNGSWRIDRFDKDPYVWHEHALKYYEFGGWI